MRVRRSRLASEWIAGLVLLGVACTGTGGGPSDAPASLAAETSAEAAPPLFDGLGSHHWAVTTSDPRAQTYFDQGLALAYGFNHAAAIRAFAYAAKLDPKCAMCSWGVSFAHGPNINMPMGEAEAKLAWAALQEAQA